MAEYLSQTPIVIRQNEQSWVKVVAVLGLVAAIVFAYLWSCSLKSAEPEEAPQTNKAGKVIKPVSKPAPPPVVDEDSEDELIIDPDLSGGQGVPPFSMPNPMMPAGGRDLPPMGSTGNFPMDTAGGPPPPIKVGRGDDMGGGFGDGGGGGGGNDMGGPRAYGGRRRKGVSIHM